MADGLVRPVIFDALVVELGFTPLVPGPVGADEAVPATSERPATTDLESVIEMRTSEPATEPFPTVEVSA